jgi:ornithine cyclodeaminase/alanine dehydrogenase-like protein (mu-crystallin family)
MALWLSNSDVGRVLTMDMTLEALEQSYRELISGEITCRPKITLRFPTRDPSHIYNWGTMEGGSCASGYFAIRVKSDVVYKQHYGATITREKYCVRPGLFCGLIMLFRIENGEPLAIMNDGVLQHFRVGADSGIGAKYVAKPSAEVVGMLGSGGMARSHMEAFVRVRKVKKLKVHSPTPEHRQAYAREMSERHGVEAVAVDTPREVFREADIIAGCTDAQVPVIIGEWLEPGTHITCVGGRWDQATHDRVDIALRLGTAPAPTGLPEWRTEDEGVVYSAFPQGEAWKNHTVMQREYQEKRRDLAIPGKTIYLEDLLARRAKGRESDRQITFSERGNVQGAQFFSVAGKVYEKACELGLGHQLPTEWFLQDIRD